MIDNSLYPEKIIYSGSKIQYMAVGHGLKLKFIDSLSFIPNRLANLSSMFGIEEMKKGFFPHTFNTRENQAYVGPYPDVSYYGVASMKPNEVEEFMVWHDNQKDKVFDLQKELVEYCRSDTALLRVACLKFRQLMMDVTDLDPFLCITLASQCGKVFRTKFLEEVWNVKLTHDESKETTEWLEAKYKGGVWKVLLNDRWIEPTRGGYTITARKFVKSPLAIVPPEGYTKQDQYSKISIEWLEYLSLTNGIYIQHALNGTGEHRVPHTKYKLDGYHEGDDGKKTAFEFNGKYKFIFAKHVTL
jgi:hypothetical protein